MPSHKGTTENEFKGIFGDFLSQNVTADFFVFNFLIIYVYIYIYIYIWNFFSLSYRSFAHYGFQLTGFVFVFVFVFLRGSVPACADQWVSVSISSVLFLSLFSFCLFCLTLTC
jgi:hypothetical protein